MEPTRPGRRQFIRACGALVALLGHARRAVTTPLASYQRVKLIKPDQSPFRLSDLEPHREYLFFYPFVSTPNFLIDLGHPTAQSVEIPLDGGPSYSWSGGIGPQQSVVAFSAICSHQLSYPSAAVSFISYRPEAVRIPGSSDNRQQARVIKCCSDNSVYDPAAGAKVLGGPAPYPLAAVNLELDEDGSLYADGVHGATLYRRFFEEFGFQLELEFGRDAFDSISEQAVVMATKAFSRQQIRCS